SENAVNQINTLEKISEIVITNYNTAISALDNIASGDINDKYSAEIKGILSVKIAELYRLFQALEDLFKGLNAAELSRVSDIFRSKNKGVFLIINDYVKQMEIIQKNIEFIGSNQVLYKTEELSNTWKILLEKLNNNFTSQREENKKLQGQLKQFIADINGVIEQINNIILDFTGKFKEQSLLTNESDTALTEFSSSIQEIAHNCEAAKTTSENSNNIAVDGKKIITQVSQEMEKINDSIKQTSNKLSELNESGRKIGNIVDIITGISEKTSLLALNAAIEAARAGESGRGFAVVADEVNKLAEQTQKSVKEISMLVDTIRVQTEMAVTSMNSAISLVQSGVNMVETASQSFGKIGESINESNNAIVEITDAVKEQEKVIDSIVGTTNKLKNINNESSVYSEKLKNTCNILKEKIVNIANIINS
ncbi:MAG TPA: methyl-accepting chemotaxis protein, partial [bacterium]|nr:methyl-accepting chemotaxis protein [bacterium]